MPGVGKTYLGAKVASLLSYHFIDTDALIERQYSHPEHIILTQGDEYFLSIEQEIVLKLDLTLGRHLLSTGGSVIYTPAIMEHLKNHSKVIYLCDSYENIYARVGGELQRGIVGLKEKTFEELYYSRLPLYEKYSDITFDLKVENHPQAIAHQLQAKFSLSKTP